MVERKWRASGPAGNPAQCYVRVGGLPFKVPKRSYDSFPESERILVAFWPRTKKMARWRKLAAKDIRAVDHQSVAE